MKPNYRYEFAPHDTAGILNCLNGHGFAIAKQLLTPSLNDALKASVCEVNIPAGKPANGVTNVYQTTFIEKSPALLAILRHKPYLDILRAIQGTDDLVIHRSAAIVRMPGDGGMGWHSDYVHPVGTPTNASEYLNTIPPEHPATSLWFYLTGCSPHDGGLALIPDSHQPDWRPPAGYELSKDRRYILRAGESMATLDMDFPGVLPVVSEPGDLLLFSITTYHGVFAHQGNQTRLSCGVSLRRRSIGFTAPWPLTPDARRFIESAPADLRKYVDGYVGLDRDWRPQPAAA